ncbi:MAG: dTDP-4-dehydrorhamnose reductase [bacterium]
MNVLIVGALGQLGSDLVKTFSDANVIAYDIEDMDITDEAKVQQQIAFTSCDLVINAAAFTRVDECEREHIEAFRVNALGVRNLAAACKRWDLPLVHISTNYIFSGEKKTPYIEEDVPSPVNAYGVTKLAGEHYLSYTWRKHYIVRVAGPFGLTPSRMKGTNFVEAMLRLAERGTPLRIVSDEYLSPTSAHDAAVHIRKLVETERYGTYHMVNHGVCSWFEFAQEIFRQAEIKVQVAPVTAAEYGAPARRPPNSSLENAELAKLGLDTMPSWQEALRDYLSNR